MVMESLHNERMQLINNARRVVPNDIDRYVEHLLFGGEIKCNGATENLMSVDGICIAPYRSAGSKNG